ncbi:hypothetical protein CAter282_3753 [Collimonas arenae]|uniref:Uncharacterized protein n=1 Tax=Collimonas arenae TaxID=279058 RepID=A0A127QN06_9BURK|nr:hypothetical protein [Collimonas arenae]AMP01537.1 hypothetical protein CAter10_4101 [Collimonas arenae]AMP11431.1 hypothetical protein CAter282_3753 [Collimonas arenae]
MATAKKRSSSKPRRPIGLVRGAVGQRESKHLAAALDTVKRAGLIERFSATYAHSAISHQFATVFPAGRKVETLGRLGLARALEPASFVREIQWAAVASYYSREVLKEFIPLRELFFKSVAKGDFAAATTALDGISAKCGESLWGLENRIALLSLLDGFEAQTKFVQKVSKEWPRSNISFMASSIGERNEPRVTASAFLQRLRSRSKSWKIGDGQRAHILYRLTNEIEPVDEAYASVLAFEGTYSSIDLYEALLDVIKKSKDHAVFDERSSVAALDFILDIPDYRIPKLLAFVQGDSKVSSMAESSENVFHEQFRRAEYKQSAASALLVLDDNPGELDAIITCAKLKAMGQLPEQSMGWFAERIVDNLAIVYSGASDAVDAADSLLKLANNLRHADFSAAMIAPIAIRTYRGFDKFESVISSATVYLDSATSFADTGARSLHKESTEAEVDGNNDGDRSEEFEAAVAMHHKISISDTDAALENAAQLESSANLYYQVLGLHYGAHLLAQSLRLEDAIKKAIAIAIADRGAVQFTPLLELIRGRTFRDLKLMASAPELAVAFYLYMEKTEKVDKEVALKVAWKHYLLTASVDRPSLLQPRQSGFSVAEKYFLSEVCRQDTMELGGAFASQLDLDKERMQICVNLARHDAENAEIYTQEIVDLARRINIEEGVQYLESSRVFVDEIGIQKWANKHLESQFLRYIDYLKAGLFTSVKELEAEIIKIVATASNRNLAITNYLDGYDVTAESLLEDVLRALMQAFLDLPRFGLDSFLSSRVRHGSFVGYLRGPLETRRVVTKKAADSTKYHDNDILLNRWQIFGDKERKIVNTKLATFSETIDTLLERSVSKYLHVHSAARPDGLVKFGAEQGTGAHAVKRWLLLLKSTLTEDTSLEQLTSYCFHTFFWPAVKYSLDSVQSYVKEELRDEFDRAIDHLTNGIDPVLDATQRETVRGELIHVRREISVALGRVALWFDLPKQSTHLLSMSLQRCLEIGLVSARHIKPSFVPDVRWDISDGANISINGPAIGSINDIAYLIFANIAKHSGFEDDVDGEQVALGIDVRIASTGNLVSIHIESDVQECRDLEEIRQGVEKAKTRIRNRDFESVTQQVKGTGLVRLAMALDPADSPTHGPCEFGLTHSSRFFVNFQISRALFSADEPK